MNVVVMRHGEAERQVRNDFDRRLTTNGAAIIEQVARKHFQKISHVKSLWASPLVRAQETARIVQKVFAEYGVDIPLNTTPLIVPEGRVLEVFDFLNNLHQEHVMLVSHQPFVGQFLDEFSGAAPGTYDMGTGSIAVVEYEFAASQLGQVEWIKHAYE